MTATATQVQMDTTKRGIAAETLQKALQARVVGQGEAIETVVELYQMFAAGLCAPNRPIANLLFLGPTGCGKTRLVEAMAEALFGSPTAMIKVDCGEFQHSHEIAKLIGSPPGYIGHRETGAMITQDKINAHQSDKPEPSLLLFDEIEKASDALWNLLLGVMDKGCLTLGDNRRVDLSSTMVFMTSNLGTAELDKMATGHLGFAPTPVVQSQQRADHIVLDAARRKFSQEFINRLDKMVVFHALGLAQLQEILRLEVRAVQDRVIRASGLFTFGLTKNAEEFLLLEGTDSRYGARHLRRAVERNLVPKLSNIMAGAQAIIGETLKVDAQNGKIVFIRECSHI